ncbi:MAG: hypothetical protein KDC46_13835 [Thermoleophilia bacterium]|nr:hypothetical protein [Thermoleophilia bacterium]
MYIAPVFPEFKYVKIRRTGGILGVDQSLHVGSDLDAKVTDRHRGDRTFELDAFTSQELMKALAELVERNPDPSTRQGCDLFHYDIELAYDGKVYHFDSVDLGADEALHGVMLAANQLIDKDPNPVHIMQLHVDA